MRVQGPAGALWAAFGFAKRRTEPRNAATPAGLRLYAVGDIHGRSDLLEGLFRRIDQDLQGFTGDSAVEIYLGDHIDRGHDSRGVLDLLIARSRSRPTVCLLGNHEAMFLDILDRVDLLPAWRKFGGLETLASYSVKPRLPMTHGTIAAMHAELKANLPQTHLAFLRGLELHHVAGDYVFVHAGLRPGIPLSTQNPQDLLWIRDEFLNSAADFGGIVVHGHTPVLEPEIRANRIAIDTGAYLTSRLTCLVLEGEERRFL